MSGEDGIVDRAATELHAGRPVVIPTDTVYGIAALPRSPVGVQAIFRIKGRPADKALPVLASAPSQLEEIAVLDERAQRLARRFWPGGLTVVVPRAPGFDVDLGGEDPATVAVRVPDDAVAAALMREVGPLAVTSANRSGEPPARSCDEAQRALGREVACYLDGGERSGEPSTVVSLVGDAVILRAGAIAADAVVAAATA